MSKEIPEIQTAADAITTAEWLLPNVIAHLGVYSCAIVDAARALNDAGYAIRATHMKYKVKAIGKAIADLADVQAEINADHDDSIRILENLGIDLPSPECIPPVKRKTGGR